MSLPNTVTIRRENCRTILRAVRQAGVATKKDVMEQTGLSFSTCNNLMNEMVKTGELHTLAQLRAGETGRPSVAYQINETYALVLCVSIECSRAGTVLRSAVADLYGRRLRADVHACPQADRAGVLQIVREAVQQFPRIAVVGFSVPGIIGTDGTILQGDCPLLDGVNLANACTQTFGLPALCENDMNLLAYGLNLQADCAELGSVAVIADYNGIPQGAGIVVDGRIIRGSTNFAGEISFLPAAGASHLERLSFQIACLTAVLDPALIAIVGDRCTPEELPQLRAQLRTVIPPQHCPEITVLSNRENAEDGLIRLCLSSMESGGGV